MISFVELDALQYAKSNDFSFSKELVRFVPDVLYCGARFIMGGKQTGEHTCSRQQKILLSILYAFDAFASRCSRMHASLQKQLYFHLPYSDGAV